MHKPTELVPACMNTSLESSFEAVPRKYQDDHDLDESTLSIYRQHILAVPTSPKLCFESWRPLKIYRVFRIPSCNDILASFLDTLLFNCLPIMRPSTLAVTLLTGVATASPVKRTLSADQIMANLNDLTTGSNALLHTAQSINAFNYLLTVPVSIPIYLINTKVANKM